MIDVNQNYETFIRVLKSLEREGTDTFIKWLDKSDFKTAPASTKNHLAVEGGLCQHCLNVVRNIDKDLLKQEDYASADFVALLCNISKVNFYEVSQRNVKDENGEWKQVNFYKVKEEQDRLIFGSNAMNSYYMLSKFFKMSYDEELAIIHHNGGYDIYDSDMSRANTASAFRKSKLALAVYLAETKATFIDDMIADE